MLDARRCLAWLLQAPGVFPFEYRVALGNRTNGCDDCQEVCPPNRAGPLRTGRGPAAGWAGARPRVARQRGPRTRPGRPPGHAGGYRRRAVVALWPLVHPRRDPRYLRRNALIALGNAVDGRSEVVEVDAGPLPESPDDLLRAHAVWAALRLGRAGATSGEPPGRRPRRRRAVGRSKLVPASYECWLRRTEVAAARRNH